jgi:hypothetical protein
MVETKSPSPNVKLPDTPVAVRRSRHLAVSVLAVVILVAAVGGTYFWQHDKYTAEVKLATDTNNKFTAADEKLMSATTLVTNFTKQVSTLSTENKQLGNELSSSSLSSNVTNQESTPADLSLTVNGAEYVNPDGTVTQGGTWFGVDFTLTNNTSNTINVTDNDFQLKDAHNNLYPEETTVGASTLPAGWVSLNNPTLAPGNKVGGVITFIMPNTTIKNFTFINGTNTYPLTSAN